MFAFLCVTVSFVRAQGVVSSSLGGFVRDESGKAVSGSTVTATHEPTGTVYTAVSHSDGRFDFRGMIPGGPYTISAGASSFKSQTKTDIYTELGQEGEVDFGLAPGEEVVQMDKISVEAQPIDLDAGATGSASVMDSRHISATPSVSRSFNDLISKNPYVSFRAGDAIVALGQNNKFNNISVDGARINDQFGLNASGLASFNNPFSLDTLEQVDVSLSPYDVRESNFTGASVNIITKRGTNEFSGSAYYYYTDYKRQGADVTGTTLGQRSLFYQRISGLTFGGPIIKNKLFFFLNYEKYQQITAPSQAGLIPDPTVLSAIQSHLSALTNVNLGTFGGGTNQTSDIKRLAKIDWNITQDHRLSIRYSDTKGTKPNLGSFNSSSFSVSQPASPSIATPDGTTSLTSTFYTEKRIEKVFAGQIFSNWTPDFKTQINYSQTSFSDPSVTPVIFPEIRIFNVPGVSQRTGASVTDGALRIGSEESRQGNEIDTKTKSFGANGDYFLNQFTLTAGFDREDSRFYNLFRQSSYGVFDYTNPNDFIADVAPRGFTRAIVQTGTPVADISKFNQTGVFGQVKWNDALPRLTLTLGVRADFIGSPIKPLENTAFAQGFGLSNTGTVDGTQTIAPRFSFNYGIDHDRMTQVRGGVGEFLGRAPWVFFSNSYGNTGVGRYSVTQTAATGAPTLSSYLATQFDPANPIGTGPLDPGGSRDINLMQNKLKLPTVVRGNIAVDRKLPFLDANLTVEYIHTKAIESLFIYNMNLKPIGVGADGRTRFAGNPSPSTAGSQLVPGFNNVYRVRNISEGSSDFGSIQIERPMKNHWSWAAAYTRGRSIDAQNFGSSTASSNFRFNSVFNQNTVELGHSDYEIRDRIQLSLLREFELAKGWRSTVGLYYEARSGARYSWTYTGDANGDGVTANDLISVPTGPTDPRFDFSGMTSAQVDAYFAALKGYGLMKYAGGYVPRNSFFQPWQNRLDLHLSQDIPTYGKLKLEVFLDFLNFGSWLSKGLFNYQETLPVPTNTGLVRSLGNASYTSTGQIKPTATFDSFGNVTIPSGSAITANNGDARWKIEFGARVKF